MPLFEYRGRDARGARIAGQLEAASTDAVARYLLDAHITPVDIGEARAAAPDPIDTLRKRLAQRPVALVDLIFFSRQMYTLLRAGVPILDALRGLKNSTANPRFAAVIENLREALDEGLELNVALRRHPDVFPSLYVSIVAVGEASGALAMSFHKLSGYLEKEHEIKNKIVAAMRYPLIVLIFIAAAMFIINLFVIPAFAQTYAHFRAELPLPTRLLIATSQFTVAYWHLILLAAGALTMGARAWVKTPAGRRRWHEYKLKIPLVGDIVFRAALARFAHSMAINVRSGVPFGAGITAAGHATDNEFIAGHIQKMREGVERGETLSRTAAATGLFPPLVLQMFQVGEQTGALDELLSEVGEFYEREVDYQLKNLSAALEPLLLVAVGILVLILALGVFMPMWNLASAAFHK